MITSSLFFFLRYLCIVVPLSVVFLSGVVRTPWFLLPHNSILVVGACQLDVTEREREREREGREREEGERERGEGERKDHGQRMAMDEVPSVGEGCGRGERREGPELHCSIFSVVLTE